MTLITQIVADFIFSAIIRVIRVISVLFNGTRITLITQILTDFYFLRYHPCYPCHRRSIDGTRITLITQIVADFIFSAIIRVIRVISVLLMEHELR